MARLDAFRIHKITIAVHLQSTEPFYPGLLVEMCSGNSKRIVLACWRSGGGRRRETEFGVVTTFGCEDTKIQEAERIRQHRHQELGLSHLSQHQLSQTKTPSDWQPHASSTPCICHQRAEGSRYKEKVVVSVKRMLLEPIGDMSTVYCSSGCCYCCCCQMRKRRSVRALRSFLCTTQISSSLNLLGGSGKAVQHHTQSSRSLFIK